MFRKFNRIALTFLLVGIFTSVKPALAQFGGIPPWLQNIDADISEEYEEVEAPISDLEDVGDPIEKQEVGNYLCEPAQIPNSTLLTEEKGTSADDAEANIDNRFPGGAPWTCKAQ